MERLDCSLLLDAGSFGVPGFVGMALVQARTYNRGVRAVVYTEYGSPDVLRVAEMPKPSPTANELLIRVRAAEATKGDCELRSFNFAVKWFWLPLRLAMGLRKPKRPVLGGYLSGVVEAVGEDVTAFQPGDAIFGCAQLRLGGYGEYVCLPQGYTLVRKPENISFEQAAAVPLGGLNALHFLTLAGVTTGDRVLINGAGGSIGSFGVQIAKALGAEVTAVDIGFKEEFLRRIGADHFIDYTQEDFTTRGERYDVIFDMVAGSSYSGCMRSLQPAGRYVKGNPRLSDMLRCTLTSLFTQRRASFAFAGEKREELLSLKSMLEAGQVLPVIDQVFSFERAPEAHRRVETEQRLGIVVITSEAV